MMPYRNKILSMVTEGAKSFNDWSSQISKAVSLGKEVFET